MYQPKQPLCERVAVLGLVAEQRGVDCKDLVVEAWEKIFFKIKKYFCELFPKFFTSIFKLKPRSFFTASTGAGLATLFMLPSRKAFLNKQYSDNLKKKTEVFVLIKHFHWEYFLPAAVKNDTYADIIFNRPGGAPFQFIPNAFFLLREFLSGISL